MADQINKGEDEYQLSEDNKDSQFQNPEYADNTSKRSNMNEGGKAKRIVLIAISALVILLAFYKVVGFFVPGKNDGSNVEVVEEVQTPPVSVPQFDQSALENVNENRIADVEKEISLRENEINSIIVNLSSIQNSFADLGDQIENLQGNISTLSQQVAYQQDTITQLQEEQDTQDDNRTIYYIQAIIPGRAWLKGSDGSTLTVRAGSEIPDYGTVSIIDVNQAIITVNTGEVIGYDPNDS